MKGRLLAALWERQTQKGWSDRRFATGIRISNPTLSLMRSGTRDMGIHLDGKIIRRFPEYTHVTDQCQEYPKHSAMSWLTATSA